MVAESRVTVPGGKRAAPAPWMAETPYATGRPMAVPLKLELAAQKSGQDAKSLVSREMRLTAWIW